ncbi:MarR family transcriptional regulator [Aeromicrobium stalagmiti]|uniref:arsenate reductase/protein-tyrosine-phosphatase family protein n=1 Tax=Aeromicrobium stalagmiti TaxID=2738988 RepID=UPI001568332B|nr:MarR family transcriptional regulator [Aeromicrobium stalagmiti]NRQ49623.1 helix-turn-helix domain-containing protein [Aeromicrobium stalagmiti]
MNIERPSLARRAAHHAALADVARLAVVDALAAGDLSPSEIQVRLGLPSNLVAHHLKVLQDVGIVARRRSEGDRRRTYLTLTDHSALGPYPVEPTPVDRVVFVCSANSARSQLAAALWAANSDVPVASAGTRPAEQVAAGARAAADRHGLTLAAAGPQRLADVAADGDLLVAVCDNAYEELGSAVAIHWSIADPVPQGDEAAFDLAHAELDRRIGVLAPRLAAS